MFGNNNIIFINLLFMPKYIYNINFYLRILLVRTLYLSKVSEKISKNSNKEIKQRSKGNFNSRRRFPYREREREREKKREKEIEKDKR